jgi:hypothetical protein
LETSPFLELHRQKSSIEWEILDEITHEQISQRKETR